MKETDSQEDGYRDRQKWKIKQSEKGKSEQERNRGGVVIHRLTLRVCEKTDK